MKTTENAERNLQSIISMYQHDRRRFFQQKLQLESYIQKELGLSEDWIVELSYNQLKIITYEDYSIYEQNRICKCLEKYVKNVSVVTDYISKSVQITMELKRMEDDGEETMRFETVKQVIDKYFDNPCNTCEGRGMGGECLYPHRCGYDFNEDIKGDMIREILQEDNKHE